MSKIMKTGTQGASNTIATHNTGTLSDHYDRLLNCYLRLLNRYNEAMGYTLPQPRPRDDQRARVFTPRS